MEFVNVKNTINKKIINGIYFSNKSECEPVLKAVNINSSLLMEYIKSQSGCI